MRTASPPVMIGAIGRKMKGTALLSNSTCLLMLSYSEEPTKMDWSWPCYYCCLFGVRVCVYIIFFYLASAGSTIRLFRTPAGLRTEGDRMSPLTRRQTLLLFSSSRHLLLAFLFCFSYRHEKGGPLTVIKSARALFLSIFPITKAENRESLAGRFCVYWTQHGQEQVKEEEEPCI